MANTWYSDDMPPMPKATPLGAVRLVLRACGIIVIFGLCLIVLLLLRLVEIPFYGAARPFSPRLAQLAFRVSLHVIGLRRQVTGTPMRGQGVQVSNHISWLDIFALNATTPVYFVAKAEVSRWPVIGFLARTVGTVFISRNRQQAGAEVAIFRARLAQGHRLFFFPEGTSTDGTLVLPFKPTLFAALFDPALPAGLQVQPVTLHYDPPAGVEPRFYGWWGDMYLGPHLLAVLQARKQGRVCITYHPPVAIADMADRKALARTLETQVRDGLAQHRIP